MKDITFRDFKMTVKTLKAVGRVDMAWALMEQVAGQWENMPEGWGGEDVKSLWRSLGGKKGSVKLCMKKMKGKVTNEAKFCASIKDKATGKTTWRKGPCK